MPLCVTCTCGRALNLRDELAGKLIRCPGCSAPLRLPKFDVVEEVFAGPPPVPKASLDPPVRRRNVPERPRATPPPLPPQTIQRVPPKQVPMMVTEFVDETVVSSPPLPRQKSQAAPATPALQGDSVAKPIMEPAPLEEDIPEFAELEVLDNEPTDKIVPRQAATSGAGQGALPAPDWDNVHLQSADNPENDADEDEWEAAWLQKVAQQPRDLASPQTDAGLDAANWEKVQLAEMAALPNEHQPSAPRPGEASDEHDSSAAYALSADTGAGLDLSAVGQRSELRIDADHITCLAYGADHKTHLAAGDDEVFLLDFTQRDSTPLLRMHSGTIRQLVISADCRLALSGDDDGGLLLWDLVRLEPARWLDGHRSAITALAFSPNGIHAASGGAGGAVWLWKLATGERLPLPQGQFDCQVSSMAFSPDSRLLVAVGRNGKARLWNTRDYSLASKLERGPAFLNSVGFDVAGKTITAGSERRFKVCKWDVEDGARLPVFLGFAKRQNRSHRTWVCSQGSCLMVLSNKMAPEKRNEDPEYLSGLESQTGIYIYPWYLFILMKADENFENTSTLYSKPTYFLELWDSVYQRGLSAVALGSKVPQAVACSPDGHRAIVALEDGKAFLFSL